MERTGEALWSAQQSGENSWIALNLRSAKEFWVNYGINFVDSQRLDPALARQLLQALSNIEAGRTFRLNQQ